MFLLKEVLMKSFLIVEDSAALIKYCEFLIKARFKDASITCVHNGKEALEKTREREYSVILSDIQINHLVFLQDVISI